MMISMSSSPKRDKLISAAATLFHQRGLGATSLADIATQAQVPIGNVYYYFKTKEELALCVLEKRAQLMEHAYAMIEASTPDPRARLCEMLRIFDAVKHDYAAHGCPVGRLIAEADTLNDNVTQAAVAVLMRCVTWAATHFEKLGHGEVASDHAMAMMGGIQGATLMARACGSPLPLSQEIARLTRWIDTLPNTAIHLSKAG